jgi:hypothetical protein
MFNSVGNQFVQVDGASFVLLITTPNFKCSALKSSSQIGFVYKLKNAQVNHFFFHVKCQASFSFPFTKRNKIANDLVVCSKIGRIGSIKKDIFKYQIQPE